jgi:CHAT domain/SEFIR domain/AAA ATPase domain
LPGWGSPVACCAASGVGSLAGYNGLGRVVAGEGWCGMASAGGTGAGTGAHGRAAARVFISYAHDDGAHEDRVRDFWLFLRACGIDALVDLTAAETPQDWAQWMTRQIGDAGRVLVIASLQYKRRADGDAGPEEGRGVQWEARLIRDRYYADQQAGVRQVLPVVLPGCSVEGIPAWLSPASSTHYVVSEYTVAGAERLLRVLTGRPWETEPPLGGIPDLPPRDTSLAAIAAAARPGLGTQVLIEARAAENGQVTSAVWLAGSPLCQRTAPLPAEVAGVWGALELPALMAAERMAAAGRRLAGVLLDDAGQRVLAGVLDKLTPGQTAEVVLCAEGLAAPLPVELIRLATDGGGEAGPLGLLPGVSVYRCLAAPAPERAGDPGPLAAPRAAAGTAGPLKVLAAVAAPDETKTRNAPLDAEAEMQAVLDAVTEVAGQPDAQVRILEVASLAAIDQALQQDAYHVLHLSAHGSMDSVELEDEDGAPIPVTAQALMGALQHAGRTVPLIVLSSCSGGSGGTGAMAASLIERGADRVIAMLAPVTDGYATTLARHLYAELARPGMAAGQALAWARHQAEQDRSGADQNRASLPEYGVATLLAAGADGPLVNPAAPAAALTVVTMPPGGTSVRELKLGALIGRRAELRTAMGVLRRTRDAVTQFGAASGVQVTGIGGIGKTALAGRIITRLRADGWLIAVHEGRWNPTALITATIDAIGQAMPQIRNRAQAEALAAVREGLADPRGDDGPKLEAVAGLLGRHRLLVVLDDFEQNLTAGGGDFLDHGIGQAITALADAADTGALLVTCRYPLPGPDRFLARIPIPPLSAAELRRLFLRMPALAGLAPGDKQLLAAAIGGHPRLIEFTDALLRGGRASLRPVQLKLRDLASAKGIDLRQDRPVTDAARQAMILGSADILLTELLELLTPRQATILDQVAVSRAPMALDDLAYALTPAPADGTPAPATDGPDLAGLRADTERLTDLTLLAADDDIVMHPWTADLVTRNTHDGLDARHERALAMRLRRFEQQRGDYNDLLDIPRHLAALHRYDDIASVAGQATRILPGTLATVACLAEIRPLIPPGERAWTIVAMLETDALLSAGDLAAATRQLHVIHQHAERRAAADPANTGWQRDLSVSHEKLGNVATAAGDLAAARAAYQASLDIAERLAAADPANTGWQRDLSVMQQKIDNLGKSAEEA